MCYWWINRKKCLTVYFIPYVVWNSNWQKFQGPNGQSEIRWNEHRICWLSHKSSPWKPSCTDEQMGKKAHFAKISKWDDIFESKVSWSLNEFFYFFVLFPTTILRKINPLTTNVPHHIETSPLICIANQLTGFYIIGNIGY